MEVIASPVLRRAMSKKSHVIAPEKVRLLMKSKGLSQNALAKAAGVDSGLLSDALKSPPKRNLGPQAASELAN